MPKASRLPGRENNQVFACGQLKITSYNKTTAGRLFTGDEGPSQRDGRPQMEVARGLPNKSLILVSSNSEVKKEEKHQLVGRLINCPFIAGFNLKRSLFDVPTPLDFARSHCTKGFLTPCPSPNKTGKTTVSLCSGQTFTPVCLS